MEIHDLEAADPTCFLNDSSTPSIYPIHESNDSGLRSTFDSLIMRLQKNNLMS